MNEEQVIFDLLFAILLFSLLSQALNADPQRGGQILKRNPQQLWQTLNMFDLPFYAQIFSIMSSLEPFSRELYASRWM